MSGSTPPVPRASIENELLAQLGLPPSASPEDVDQAHLAVSHFLAAAPAGIRAWARVQAAALDEAYLQLTDPVGLEGSALSSPTRPPTVVPGGPATPPARRDSLPAAQPHEDSLAAARPAVNPVPVPDAASSPGVMPAEAESDGTDTDDLDALYAAVTPGAHRDMVSGGRTARQSPKAVAAPARRPDPNPARRTPRVAPSAAAPVASPSTGPWKLVALASSAVLALVVVIGFVVPFVFSLGAPSAVAANSAAPSASGPAVDMAKVTALMTQLQGKPNDVDTMMQLGNTYFEGADYADAATFYGKVVAIQPNNIKALLANGAAAYNQNDTATAERLWKQVVALKPTEKAVAQEVHYDLGVLYMHSTSPDWASVLNEWRQVIDIDPTSDYASNVQQYAAALAGSSMVPSSLTTQLKGLAGPLPSAGASAGAASGSPMTSASATPSMSAAPSAAPSAAASPAPSASGSAVP
ncbi:MAG TPA: hypothetical protein VIR16_05690 [Candidatus Limnocylindrales bacterium]